VQLESLMDQNWDMTLQKVWAFKPDWFRSFRLLMG
jgi:hypothetical protein